MENRILLRPNSNYSLDLETLEVIENGTKMKVATLGAQPIFTIAGTDFYVEIQSQTLIEVSDPKNHLPVGDMIDTGKHYEFPYHLEYKNWPCQLDDPKESIDVKVPYLIVLDPVGMASKYNIDPVDLIGRKDIEFLNPNYQGFLARIAGELPTIDIAGESYLINVEKGQLILKADANHSLEFKDFQKGCPLSDDFSYRFTYDKIKKVVISETEKYGKGGNYGIVELPVAVKLDPVGLARKLGYNDDHFIRDYPMEKKLTASVSDIKGIEIPDGIANSGQKERQRKNRHGL